MGDWRGEELSLQGVQGRPLICLEGAQDAVPTHRMTSPGSADQEQLPKEAGRTGGFKGTLLMELGSIGCKHPPAPLLTQPLRREAQLPEASTHGSAEG